MGPNHPVSLRTNMTPFDVTESVAIVFILSAGQHAARAETEGSSYARRL